MKARTGLSRRQGSALIASLVLVAVLAMIRNHGLPAALRPDDFHAALAAERTRLTAFTDERLAALRAELAQTRALQKSDDAAIPAGWQVRSPPAENAETDVIHCIHEGLVGWRDLLAHLVWFETHHRILALDIRSTGTRHRRDIARVEITVAGAPGFTRQLAGASFPGAAGPASPGRSGRTSTPRRPPLPDGCAARRRLPVRCVTLRPDPPGSGRSQVTSFHPTPIPS